MLKTPDLTFMIQQLIATPSVSSTRPSLDMSNRPVIDLLADWFSSAGFQVEILPVPGETDKANLLATLGRGEGGLVLAGHTDTVPYDDGLWQHDPFKLTESDNRLYGLGTSDMKSFLALILDAVSIYDADDFHRPLMVLATADEETSMSGAQILTARDLSRARYAVIGEPTNLQPVRQHKGMMMESIKLIGSSGHSSDPGLGNNALEGMHVVISELLKWRNELQAKFQNPAFAVPVPTLNFGHIHGGDNPNRICGDCELHLDLRPLPGMSLQTLREEIQRRVAAVCQPRNLAYECKSLFMGIEPMQTDALSPIVQTAEALTQCESTSVAFGTEAPYLNNLGIDTLILGPGDIAQAHQPDEFLHLDRIKPTLGLLRQLITRFCLQP